MYTCCGHRFVYALLCSLCLDICDTSKANSFQHREHNFLEAAHVGDQGCWDIDAAAPKAVAVPRGQFQMSLTARSKESHHLYVLKGIERLWNGPGHALRSVRDLNHEEMADRPLTTVSPYPTPHR